MGSGLKNVLGINGARITYELVGDGPPLVLLHAGIADRRMWDGQMQDFSRHFTVLRYDRRGIGDSTMSAEPFSHHADLKEIMRGTGIERAHIVGLSMGASVAIDFALSFPDMVNRLVLSSVLGPPPRSESLRAGWVAAETAYEKDGLAGVNEIEMQIWVDGPTRSPDEVDPHVRSAVAVMNIGVLRSEDEAEVEGAELDPPAWERLRDINAPTLVITGDIDQPDVVQYTQRLANEIGNARLEVITGTAHMVNMEAPERFNELVVNFLTE